ncbi:MAG: hypothetical protein JWO76_3347 [Nocardioides sp.]|nr:hypothetical protein [Nocardioides sp.]
MDPQEYVAARHPLLVRAAVLMGRPLDRARELVAQTLRALDRRVRRADDPDPVVLRELHRAVLADRLSHPDEAQPRGRPDQPAGLDDEGLAVRRALAEGADDVRDAAVLLYFAHLTDRDAADSLDLRARELPALATSARELLGAPDADAARHLLAQAGDTVLVEPPEPTSTAPGPQWSRRWAVPLTLLALVAAGTALSLVRDPDREDPASLPEPSGLPSALRGDQLPSLFGYRARDATERLRRFALRVRVERVSACEPPGLVLATSPATGARFQPGETVVLTAAGRRSGACGTEYRDRAAAWAFVDFAVGRGPAPPFAATASVYVDGDGRQTLTRDRGADRSSWPVALSRVRDETGLVGLDGTTYVTPVLAVQHRVPPADLCGVPRPAELGSRPALELSLGLPDASGACPLTVDLYGRAGLIDTVVVRGPRPAGSAPAGDR